MSEEEKISLIEETIGLVKGTLSADTELRNLEMWDSIGKLFILSVIKMQFGRDIDASIIRGFRTVSDILSEMRG